jgi:excisionase family DNA binding protein
MEESPVTQQLVSDEARLSVAQVARELHCSYNTILNAIRQGRLRAYRPSRNYVVLGKDLNKFWQDSRVQPTEEAGGRHSSSPPPHQGSPLRHLRINWKD